MIVSSGAALNVNGQEHQVEPHGCDEVLERIAGFVDDDAASEAPGVQLQPAQLLQKREIRAVHRSASQLELASSARNLARTNASFSSVRSTWVARRITRAGMIPP